MLGRTHIAIALATTAVIIKEPAQLPLSLTVAAVSSLLPDMDTPNSMLRHQLNKYIGILTFPALITAGYFLFRYKYFSMLGLILYLAYITFAFIGSHRGFTHSLSGFGLFTLILFMSNKAILLPALIGYSTHLAADLFTPSGIPLFYPYNRSFKIPLIRTGSFLDIIFCFVAIVLFIIKLSQNLL